MAYRPPVLRCRLLGHRFRFSAAGPVLAWRCERGCGAGGEKRYDDDAQARRYATAFDVEGRRDAGRPLLSALPARLIQGLLRRRRGE